MRLPPNMHAPEVEATVRNFKQMISGQAADTVNSATRAGQPVRDAAAVAMMGLLDAALEQWLIWHRAQKLPFDADQFGVLVQNRLLMASARVDHCQPGQPSSGGLQ